MCPRPYKQRPSRLPRAFQRCGNARWFGRSLGRILRRGPEQVNASRGDGGSLAKHLRYTHVEVRERETASIHARMELRAQMRRTSCEATPAQDAGPSIFAAQALPASSTA